jgi:YD repeat-containing protein
LARAASVTDRNGNLIAITYPNGNEVDYADQLGRVTKIQKNIADPQNPSVMLALLVTIPGYQGQTRYFKVKTAVMNQRFRSGISPMLPVINGDYDPLGWGLSWGTATRLFPGSHGTYAERIDTAMVLSECVLPDGRSLQFFYNEFGEVAEVQMPTGGKAQYDYQYVTNLPAGKSLPGEISTSHFASTVSDVERGVVARRTYPDGVTKDADWAYSYTVSTAQVTATSAAGVVLLNQKHYFLANGRNLYPGPGSGPLGDRGVDGSGYNLWSTGIERRTETLNAAGTAVIAASEQDWTQRTPIVWTGTNYGSYQTENDNRVNEERKILDDLSMAKVDTFYDQYNNRTEVKEYDFDQSLKRRTTISYLATNNGFNYVTDDSIHLLRLPLQQSVYDGGGTERARTNYDYDNYANDTLHAPLVDHGIVTGHDSAYSLSKTTRGNTTASGRWLNTTGATIYSYPRYDTLGNAVSAKDANGNVVSIDYTDDYGAGSNPGGGVQGSYGATYALPTLITSPPPIAGAPQQTARSQYDFSTGLLTGFKDRNGIITQTIYNDALDRPTQIKSALGVVGVESHAAMYYAPATAFGITLAKNDVLTVSDQASLDDAVLRAWTRTDGFGRTTEGWKRDPQGDVKAMTIYDGLGRAVQSSNPFRPSAGEVAIYTTTVYDLASRIVSVTTPDSAVVTTSYSSNTVTVTDQLGKARRSITDGLGRLTRVDEPDAANNLGTVAAPMQPTTYANDALDDLTTVSQGTQTRTFVYDSLKRLTSATNPESGTISYQYDANSNLVVKTDARAASSHYSYDALNRPLRRWYNGSNLTTATVNNSPALPSGVGASDEASYFYDTQTLPSGAPTFARGYSTGRLVAMTYGAGSSAGDYYGYDAGGRALLKIQQTGGINCQASAVYDRVGERTGETYPSGRTVSYAYDTAGRTSSLTGNLGDGINRNYATEMIYSPLGGMTKEKFGTDTALYNKLFYNSRGQLSEIREGTSYTGPNDTGWERGAIINYYGDCWGMCGGSNSTTPMTNNNGNLKKQEIFVPGASSWLQQYDYDNLNRLQGVSESAVGTTLWRQEYVYDRYGNRTIHQTNTWGSGIPKPNFGVATASNRLTPLAGYTMSYDAAGNLTNDTYTGAGSRTYDAENRMTTAWGGNNQSQVYNYNADGQRTRRKVDGVETWQVYGMDGELLAEYATNGAPASPQKEYGYRNGQLLITAEPSGRANVALTANGGVATASSSTPPSDGIGNYEPSSAINGDRRAVGTTDTFSNNTFWRDGTNNAWPDWWQVDFNGSKSIDEIDVITLQDNYLNPVEPTETMTFSAQGITSFDVQYWNGSAWVTVTGGSVTGNNKVWKKLSFAPVTTSKVRVTVNAALNSRSRIVEVEAWGTAAAPPPQNVTWTNVTSTITVTGNSIQKTSGTNSWFDAGATSTQTITSGDGYVEFTPGDITTWRMCGLGNGMQGQKTATTVRDPAGSTTYKTTPGRTGGQSTMIVRRNAQGNIRYVKQEARHGTRDFNKPPDHVHYKVPKDRELK